MKKLYIFHAPAPGCCLTVRSLHPRGRLSYDGAIVRLDGAYAERVRDDWPDALEEIDEKRFAATVDQAKAVAEAEASEGEGDEKAAAKKTTAKKTSRAG